MLNLEMRRSVFILHMRIRVVTEVAKTTIQVQKANPSVRRTPQRHDIEKGNAEEVPLSFIGSHNWR